ncbi:putative trichothecene 3-O-acetyltransferase [Ascobolus immersus RN42]|uniref:Putative trichothecene 3-O-acetyltransferase n=1 Tax=Ascobolus immersus RN42 TaxID=1160509 RepID=A0A3N4I0R3_ASCIM|nr:putative trichothecene 3-O-acetyltransferase [Ascobolus immersus RN42]
MTDTTQQDDWEVILDILAQRPGRFIYTQIALCYPTADDSTTTRDGIITTLKSGLERLSASFPWVAGQVIQDMTGVPEGSTGVFKIKPYKPTPLLFIKNLAADDPSFPTYAEMKEAGFPMRMFKEEVVCPRGTLKEGFSDPSLAGVDPALLIQVNIVQGGLILSVCAEHHVVDATGHGIIMDLLDKACHATPFTPDELSAVNLDRTNIIPLLPMDKFDPSVLRPKPPITLSPAPSPPASASPPTPNPSLTWHHLHFPPTSLDSLKSLASTNLPATTPYITTDDALTAFIFQRILASRLHRLPPDTPTTLIRAVNVRPYFPVIPALYPGMIINSTLTTFPLADGAAAPLSALAAPLREAVQKETSTLARDTSTFATLLSISKDKTLGGAASFDADKNVMLSSWTKMGCYELDFALGLGKPEAVRRPSFESPFGGVVYFLPMDGEGGIDVVAAVRGDEGEVLRGDEEVKRLAREVV